MYLLKKIYKKNHKKLLHKCTYKNIGYHFEGGFLCMFNSHLFLASRNQYLLFEEKKRFTCRKFENFVDFRF